MAAGGDEHHVERGAGRHAGDGFQRQGGRLLLEHDALDEVVVVLGIQHDDAARHRGIDQLLLAQGEAAPRTIAASVGFARRAIGMLQGVDGRVLLEALQRPVQHAIAGHAVGIQPGLVLRLGTGGEHGKHGAGGRGRQGIANFHLSSPRESGWTLMPYNWNVMPSYETWQHGRTGRRCAKGPYLLRLRRHPVVTIPSRQHCQARR